MRSEVYVLRWMHWSYDQLQSCPMSRYREIVRQMSEQPEEEPE